MTAALISLNEAKSRLGVSGRAMQTAIEHGDLILVEMEGIRGNTRQYITAASMHAWIARLNGEDIPAAGRYMPDLSDGERRVAALSLQIRELIDKVDSLADKLSRISEKPEHFRRSRLRHTVSSRIGDAFDPHGFYVYLLWGDDDETPLYIGQSRNVLGRLGSHMQNKERRHIVKSIQIIKCSGTATMMRTEAALIREYKPPLNTSLVGIRVLEESLQ
jgi:predicted GIY-YIG superfamily endonuclease